MFYFTIKKDFDDIIKLIQEKYDIYLKNKISYSDFDSYDYQSSILFQLGNHPKKEEIKSLIIQHFHDSNHYTDVAITGKSFISLKINIDTCLEEDGHSQDQTVIVDYCGVNVAKKMHIGHIRSMFIGDYIANHHEYLGAHVIRFNHIGDWGNQFGYLLHYIQSNNLPLTDNQTITEYYKKAFTLYESDPIFKEQSAIVAKKLQSFEEPYISLWATCRDISIKEMVDITEKFSLKLKQTDILGESHYFPLLSVIEEKIVSLKIAEPQPDGSLIFKSKKHNTLILKKSNGSYLYPMTDLVALFYRINTYKPSKIIYVVDKRQSDHFGALFEMAEKLELTKNCKLIHVAFGFILGPNGTPLKTKSGDTLYMDDMLKEGFSHISKNPFYKKLPSKYKKMVIKDTLYSSLKWFDLNSNPTSDYKFNWDNILNNNSGTAPYIQHGYVRLESVLFKNLNKATDFANVIISELPNEAILLYKQTQQLNEGLFLYADEYACHKIEEAFLKAVKSFHVFYDNVKISSLVESEQSKILSLLEFVKMSFEDTAEVLGISLYPSLATYEHLQNHKNINLSKKI